MRIPYCKVFSRDKEVEVDVISAHIEWGFHPRINVFEATILSPDSAKKLFEKKRAGMELGYLNGEKIVFERTVFFLT